MNRCLSGEGATMYHPLLLIKAMNVLRFKTPRYKDVDEKDLPLTEALIHTVERILPYWNNTIVPEMKNLNQVIVAAHGNSLRGGIIKHLKNISDEDIVSLNLPTAVPYVLNSMMI